MALGTAAVMRRIASALPPELQKWADIDDLPAHPQMLLSRITYAR